MESKRKREQVPEPSYMTRKNNLYRLREGFVYQPLGRNTGLSRASADALKTRTRKLSQDLRYFVD